MPNGNVLIAVSREGRALEVTRDGDVVWEYYGPLRSDDERFTLYRMHVVPSGVEIGGLEPPTP